MKVAFVSNYLNHHQIPLCEELFRLTDGEFCFIQTEPMDEERINLGWNDNLSDKKYLKMYAENETECKDIIFNADAVIFGGTDDESYIMKRLEAGKFTLRYMERLYKTGRWKFISPRGLIKKYHDHTRFNNSPVYLLCAGGFVKGDFELINAYRNKSLKFGYFPEFMPYSDINSERINNKYINILWVGRFIDWKHPEMMLKLQKALSGCGELFSITMVGTGTLYEDIVDAAKNEINFTGPLKPDEVRTLMRKADIFISTSDREEGWGAVINEAMNSGCAVVCGDEIGAAPYLIKDGINGMTFKSKSQKDLNEKVIKLIKNKALRYSLGQNAYNTIENMWNARVAAERLYKFICDEAHKIPDYEEGPLSKA